MEIDSKGCFAKSGRMKNPAPVDVINTNSFTVGFIPPRVFLILSINSMVPGDLRFPTNLEDHPRTWIRS